ncbi:indole-3-glycerol phosphate synthase [Clostridia bacterium]|nr:indole-3-glycerol phosphate synthase [Clostridia bacterium]
MNTFLTEILKQKEKEVQAMPQESVQEIKQKKDFWEFLKENPQRMQLIAEVKRASPSKGQINMGVDPVAQAKAYERAGAGLVSVLTDELYFKGSIQDLKQVADAINLPVLCKDFFINEKQLIRARNHGANVILLIVAALSEQKLQDLFQEAKQLGLLALVEVHNEQELHRAEQLGAELIGVNNRDLHSFQVDIAVSERLAQVQSRQDCFYVSESGFKTSEDVERIKEHYQAILVGEALMREQNPEQVAESLRVFRSKSALS